MSAPSHVPLGHTAPEFRQWVFEELVKPIPLAIALFIVALTLVAFSDSQSHLKNVPLVNPPKSILQSSWNIKTEFFHKSGDFFNRARALFPGKPFRIIANMGPVTILPPELGNEIRNSPDVSFVDTMQKDFHKGIPGFEGMSSGIRNHSLIVAVARKSLTKSLTKVTQPVAHETNSALLTHLGELSEWQTFNLHEIMLDVIARASSRVFLGEDLCRNEDWLHIAKTYTVSVFREAFKMNLVPPVLRPLVHWFMPGVQELRAYIAKANALIKPIIEKRRQLKDEAVARGEPVPRYDDAIQWIEDEAKGEPHDPVLVQLGMSIAAIHTTTDLISRTVLDLACRPELVSELRAEVITMLRAEGWKKTALFNMKLMDSVIKESQRLKPLFSVVLRRLVKAPLKLSNGLEFRPGDRLEVDMWGPMLDPAIHKDPETYDPRRFLRWRETPGLEPRAHLVSTSPEHMAFGYGDHACPGRFFAANEIKIVLCHLLLQYDWKLAPGTDTTPVIHGFSLHTNPATQLLFRRRKHPELDVNSL
ncbi:cytochrome P450 [Colletotrichum somersetense]|nr:cytochrome P450 [Colletotrichum somersetense]